MKLKFKNAEQLLKVVFRLPYFTFKKGEKAAIQYHWKSAGGNNFVVIVGENATGKSFMRRLFSAVAQ